MRGCSRKRMDHDTWAVVQRGMTKRTILKGAAILALSCIPALVLAQPAPSASQCVYSGTWKSANSSGPIQWNITEEDVCCGLWALELTGSGSDSYGGYKLSGSCAEGQCTVDQDYTSGRFSGRSYTYTGDIEWIRPLDTMKGFSGNYKENGGDGSGTFSITSIRCN